MTAALAIRKQSRTSRAKELRSALYEGTVTHRRFGPGPSHEFTYRVVMPMLYLDEIEDVTLMHPLWSARRPAPVRFRREDFLGTSPSPLDQAARDLVEQRLGLRPCGPVALLANLRAWGWLFNPISLYYCTGADNETVEALVAEVENTPWHERHAYVVGPPGRHRFAKVMHVSPFMPMDVDYELNYTAPSERLSARLDVLGETGRLLGVTMSLRRKTLDRSAMADLLWHDPALTHRVSAGIYAQAARLARRGAPFFTHPVTTSTGGASEPTGCTRLGHKPSLGLVRTDPP